MVTRRATNNRTVKLSLEKTYQMTGVIPNALWRMPPLPWEPKDFMVDNPLLKSSLIEAAIQQESLDRWREDAHSPQIYIVSGSPDADRAKLFAAYLCQVHFQQPARYHHKVVWVGLHADAPKREYPEETSLLVIAGLTPNSSAYRKERVADLVEMYPTIPRIIVAAGADPLTVSTWLYQPVHSLAWFPQATLKDKTERL